MQPPGPPHQSVALKEPKEDQKKNDIEKLTVEVAQKFWSKTTEFVQAINTSEKRPPDSWIQFQTFRTHYYGVMASTFSFTNVKSKTEWVCVKVGFTQLDNNMKRPVQIRDEVIKHYAGRETEDVNLESIKQRVRVIFSVPQSPLDPRLPVDVEKALRLAVGRATSKGRGEKIRTSSSHGMGLRKRWALERNNQNLRSSQRRFVTSDEA